MIIGAWKCSGTGVRLLRNVTPSSTSPGSGVGVKSQVEAYGAFIGNDSCQAMNWSQKRFLRCLPPSTTTGSGNVNAQFTINEIENQHKRLVDSQACGNKMPSRKRSLAKISYSKSVSAHQSHLSNSIEGVKLHEAVPEVYKIVADKGSPTIRVKSSKDDVLIKEWIGIQNELQIIKQDRIEEDKRRLQIAGQQVLREMEASLRKGMNLEDLDEAIEGALCSELKDH